jgi:chromate transporter
VTTPSGSLRDVALLFLKLGTIAFGGPAAHIAMMRDEVVRRRGWMDDQEFLDKASAVNLVPGPNSTELAIEIGREQQGGCGLLVAGACFIVPAVVIVTTLAVLYDRYGTTPTAVDLRYGILPVIVAIVAQAVWGLGKVAVKNVLTGLLAAAAFAGQLAGVNELLLLALAALIGGLWSNRRRLVGGAHSLVLGVVPLPAVGAANGDDVGLLRLLLLFLKIGSVLYGSGYVLLAFLEGDFVHRLGWLTEEQLLDAVAVGQLTPGPVFTTATFIGYQLAGFAGAAVATLGIFLPAFVFVAILGPVIDWLRTSPWARGGLDALNATSLGLMAAVTAQLAGTAFPDALTVVVGLAALAVLLRFKPNSAWLVGAGAAIGLAHGLL